MSEEKETAPKKQKRNKVSVSVAKEVTTVISAGKDNYILKNTSDGRGVRVENSGGSLFIPFGDVGSAILTNLAEQVGSNQPRKRRRTNAELAASKAVEA